ncbi:MAG: nucleotide exchange factor GrpE, partial [Methanobrevibacter sp.]|nr:nucleotide exchange factor GrpE [Methanobrevibacter sp.]
MAKKKKDEKTEDLEIDEEDQSKLQEEKLDESPSEEESSQEEKEEESEDEAEDDEIAKLNKSLEEKDEEIIELKSHIQRLQADFDNFRKQGEKQKQDLIRYANEGLIVKFIDIYEDMERALENSTNEEELREGLELIYSKMKNTLEKEGVEEIPAVGEKFDPFKHEALLTVDSPDHENNEIVDEL